MKLTVPTILLATSASALTTVQPRSKAAGVVKEIAASGSKDAFADCKGGDETCTIHWTPVPGHPAAFTDHMAARKAWLDELAGIEAKLDANTATLDELRRAVKLMLKLDGLSSR